MTKLNPKKTKKQRQYLRGHMTKWEVRLWNELKGKKMFGFKVRRQHGIGNYIVDFYCPELRLAIEIDGDVHHFKEKAEKDLKKDLLLKNEGIEIIRIKNLDFEEDYESTIIYLEDVFKERAKEFNIEINEAY
ncbi:endonuclease domain-containing protein [Rhodohalobacter halophilus]|uniref:endonuclease domain-containing protein n=1 Tax=Rhodohalobacter halophilus TaxID=1812810 RepID=UPI00083F8E2F|nr:endonuclease domain-containing protein [Rhodohalobacter halophilus]